MLELFTCATRVFRFLVARCLFSVFVSVCVHSRGVCHCVCMRTYTRTEQYDGIEMMAKLYESKVWNHARLRLRGGGMIEQIKINFIAGHCLLTCQKVQLCQYSSPLLFFAR
jgi:hypothetical protein